MAVTGPGGIPAKAIAVDLSKAKVPDRRYAADVCSIVRSHGTIKIMFGQDRVDGSGWRTLLVVGMSEVSVSRFVASLLEMKPSIDEVGLASKIVAESLSTNVSEPSQPNQVASLVANLGLVAIADTEACIDFYHASAFALGAVAGRKMEVEAVVRVDLRAPLLLGLFAALRDLAIPPSGAVYHIGALTP